MIKAITPISHDGVEYLEGQELSANADQEKALVDLGVAEYVEAEVEAVEKTKKELEVIAKELGIEGVKRMNKSELADAILEAQSALEAEVEEVKETVEEPADVDDVE
jgi:ethanolamine utilization cobalamin adenosyltransferase